MSSAAWKGVMVGMEAPEYGTPAALALLRNPPDAYLGGTDNDRTDLDRQRSRVGQPREMHHSLLGMSYLSRLPGFEVARGWLILRR